MIKKIFVLFFVAISLFLVGCAQEPSDQEKAKAIQAYGAISSAMAPAYQAGMGAAAAGASRYSINETVDMSNYGGSGTLTVTGSGTETSGSYNMTLKIVFSGFTYNGISVSGTTNMTFNGDDSNFTMTYTGNYTVSGAVSMTLGIDMSYKMVASSFNYSATFTVDGKSFTQKYPQ